jgi:hypothetical protein
MFVTVRAPIANDRGTADELACGSNSWMVDAEVAATKMDRSGWMKLVKEQKYKGKAAAVLE